MRREIDRATGKMQALAQAAERRRVNAMAVRAQKIDNARPALAANPGAMHEHERG